MLSFLENLFCGSVSGFATCILGYCLDTAKVRIQAGQNLSMNAILREILFKKGFMSIWGGIYYPLVTIPVINAVTFSSYKLYKSLFGKDELSALDGFKNGAFAGLMVTFVVTPVELIKCKMQIDQVSKYSSSRACFQSIIKKEGYRGLFKGLFSTGLREIFSYSSQFAMYEYFKNKFVESHHHHLKVSEAILVGTIAAISGEIISYPLDVIKTKIQTSEKGTFRSMSSFPNQGFVTCVRTIVKREGFPGFFVGIKPCLLRACFADGLAIVVYEKCHELVAHNGELLI